MRVAVMGMGPIGREVARAIAQGARPGVELVAIVDLAPALLGQRIEGLPIERTLTRAVDAIALCTSSRFDAVVEDLERAVAAGQHVVSTCEELALPPDLPRAQALGRAAQSAGVTLIGTGVNPGFVMDRLVLELAAVCVRIEGIRVERVVDAAARREPLRHKVGYGLTIDEFRAGVAAGRLGHVGLSTSAGLIARGLRSSLAGVIETIDPVLGKNGKVLGVHQLLSAKLTDGRPIELELQMSVGAPDPHDRVTFAGDPPLDVTIAGGTHGDRATVGAVIDGLARLHRAARGLITVAELY